MERIQHALEQFKQSKGNSGRSTSPSLNGSSSIPHPLVYTHTQTMSPSPELLVANRVLTATDDGPFLESYKILRTKILHRMQEHGWNVIGVTSPGRREGKTLVSVNLAISIAMDHKQTALLVDANLRTPQVHHLFGLPNRGLADFLLDDLPLPDLLVHPEIDRLVVLPAGGPLKNSAEALNLQKMTEFIADVKHRYPSRVIVFDLPPLLETADVIGLAPRLDALLIVVEADRTKEKDLEKAISMLHGTPPILGTILNKAGAYT